MRMNGLHESNSKLNIRRYPKAKKTDSDLILLLCPRALCCRLSTFETLRRINHLSVYSAVKVTSSHGYFARLLPHTRPDVSVNILCDLFFFFCTGPQSHFHITEKKKNKHAWPYILRKT